MYDNMEVMITQVNSQKWCTWQKSTWTTLLTHVCINTCMIVVIYMHMRTK